MNVFATAIVLDYFPLDSWSGVLVLTLILGVLRFCLLERGVSEYMESLSAAHTIVGRRPIRYLDGGPIRGGWPI